MYGVYVFTYRNKGTNPNLFTAVDLISNNTAVNFLKKKGLIIMLMSHSVNHIINVTFSEFFH